MSKELKIKEDTSVAIDDNFGVADGLSASDLTIPSIKIGQAITAEVKAGEIKYGEIFESVGTEVLAKPGEKLEAIFLKVEKCLFVTSGEKGNKFERIDPFVEGYDYTEEVNGVKYQKSLSYRYYVVLAKDIKAGLPFPCVLNLMKSNMKVAKKLNTIFSKMRLAQKKSHEFVFNIFGSEVGSDNGTYYVFNVNQERTTTKEESEAAKFIFDMIGKTKLKIDDAPVDRIEADPSTKKNIEDDLQF